MTEYKLHWAIATFHWKPKPLEETYISQSTDWWEWIISSKGWTITTSWWWYDRRMYTIGTIDWYDVIQEVQWTTHQGVDIWLTSAAYTAITNNYSKMKIIYDYFNIWETFTYSWDWWSELFFGDGETYRTRNDWTITYGSQWSNITLEWSKWYSMIQDIDLSDMSTNVVIKNLSTSQEQTLSYTKTFRTNSLWPILVTTSLDQKWWPVSVWDIHIYVS